MPKLVRFPQVFTAGHGALDPVLSTAPITHDIDNDAGLLVSAANDATSFFQSSGTKRQYLVRIDANRPAINPMGVGGVGVDDAALFARYRARGADGTGVQQRGLNAQVRHSGTTGGSIGNLIGSNADPTVVLAHDAIALTVSQEMYGTATDSSGGIDVLYTHEGPNSTNEFGLRFRNAKKNGSQHGSAIVVRNEAAATTFQTYGLDLSGLAVVATGVTTAKGDIAMGSKGGTGRIAIIASGAATNDAAIVAQVGADATIADGSIYLSIVDGAGTFWQKRNDVWTSI